MFISARTNHACGDTDAARSSCLEPNDLTQQPAGTKLELCCLFAHSPALFSSLLQCPVQSV